MATSFLGAKLSVGCEEISVAQASAPWRAPRHFRPNGGAFAAIGASPALVRYLDGKRDARRAQSVTPQKRRSRASLFPSRYLTRAGDAPIAANDPRFVSGDLLARGPSCTPPQNTMHSGGARGTPPEYDAFWGPLVTPRKRGMSSYVASGNGIDLEWENKGRANGSCDLSPAGERSQLPFARPLFSHSKSMPLPDAT